MMKNLRKTSLKSTFSIFDKKSQLLNLILTNTFTSQNYVILSIL